MRGMAAAVVVLLLLGGCDPGGSDPGSGAADAPTPTTAVTEEVAEQIPSLEGLLEAGELEDCMYRERTRPDENAIASVGLLAWLVGHVESNRGLDFDVPLTDLRLLDDDAFSDAIDRLTPRSTDEDEDKLRLMSWALGMSPHGIDVNAFLEGDEAQLIAGVYDQQSGDVIVKANNPERVSPRGVITLAHELTHAATDQSFGLRPIEKVEVLDDAALAYDSVVEGDASMVEFRFLSRFSPEKAMDKALKFQIGMEDRLEKFRAGGVPEMLIDSLVFPYQWGFGFVCAVYKDGGWDAVNEMYDEKPPMTTAQVMFPQRYIAQEEAVEPRPLPQLERPWRSISSGTIGAAHLKSLFEAPGNIGSSALDKPIGRAAAWAGGSFELWRAEGERYASLAIGLVEHERYPGVLCESMLEWYEASFPDSEILEATNLVARYSDDSQSATILCDGDQIRIGISPDAEIAEALTQ